MSCSAPSGAPGTASRIAEGLLRPVEDFELLVTAVDNDLVHPLPGRGPSIPLCLDGELTVACAPASDGGLTVPGRGTVVHS